MSPRKQRPKIAQVVGSGTRTMLEEPSVNVGVRLKVRGFIQVSDEISYAPDATVY